MCIGYVILATIYTWSTVFEKLIVSQLVKKFSVFYGRRHVNTVFTRAWNLGTAASLNKHFYISDSRLARVSGAFAPRPRAFVTIIRGLMCLR
jgi:hypothetical protein